MGYGCVLLYREGYDSGMERFLGHLVCLFHFIQFRRLEHLKGTAPYVKGARAEGFKADALKWTSANRVGRLV